MLGLSHLTVQLVLLTILYYQGNSPQKSGQQNSEKYFCFLDRSASLPEVLFSRGPRGHIACT